MHRNTGLAVVATATLVACGGGGSSPAPPPPPTYSVSGTVTGLNGTVVLQFNGVTDITVSANGPVMLATSLPNATNYAVTVKSQPTAPTQTCTVTNAQGAIVGANVANVAIDCVIVPLELVSSTPANAAIDVSRDAPIVLTFSTSLNTTPEPASAISLRTRALAEPFTATPSGSQLTITPSATLALLSPYSVQVGATIRGASGEALRSTTFVSFATADGQWRTPQLLELDDTNFASVPDVAADADGNAIAVWEQANAGRYDIWASRFSGGSWSMPTLIESDDAGDAHDVQIAADTAGNAIAIWRQSDGTRDNIVTNRYVAGSGWQTAMPIEFGTGTAAAPQIAMSSNGEAIAVWHQFDGTRNNVWASRYAPGTGFSIARLVETNDAGSALDARVSIDSIGNSLLIWRQSNGTRFSLWAARYGIGSGWSTAMLVENDESGDAQATDVVFDLNGDVTVSWQQHDGTRFNIWTNRFDVTSGWGTATLIDSEDLGDAFNAQLASDRDGNLMAVWYQFDGTRFNIWANRYSAETGWGSPAVIETNDGGEARFPRIAMDTNGNALAVWRQIDGSRIKIWASRYRSGGGWAEPVLVENSALIGNALGPRIALDGRGNAHVVWFQPVNGQGSIFANRLD
jgi:uncharacterized protein YbdZ (MbtH family)